MTSPLDDANVTTPLGLLGVLGGALFPALFLALVAVAPGSGTYATQVTSTSLFAVPLLFWLPATAGLAYRHRTVFGPGGWLATAVLVAGMALTLLNTVWQSLTQGSLLPEPVGFGVFVAWLAGSLLFGAAIAYHRELPNAVADGVLLAVSFPLSIGGSLVLTDVLGVESPVLGILVVTVPYGVAWLVAGYDLTSEPDRLDVASASLED